MLQRTRRFVAIVGKRFFHEGCPIQAAGLSYISLLSVVPLMTVSFSVLTAFPVFKGLDVKLQQFIFKNFVASSAQVIQQYLNSFASQVGKLSGTGIFFLFITAVLMIFAVERVLNRIWRVERRRNAIQAFLMYWAILTLTPVLLGVGVLISSHLLGFKAVADTATLSVLKKIAFTVFPYLFTFTAFTLLYAAVPNCKVKLRYAVIGAVVASVMFELAKLGFAFYITHFPTYKLLYGALAVVPIFLVWLYFSWLILLFGAIISHESKVFATRGK